MIQDALAYAAAGIAVFPCSGKVPLTPHGVSEATTDQATIAAWWERWPQASIGVACGGQSDLWVLDSDTKAGKDGEGELASIAQPHGGVLEMPWTRTVRTPSGGVHRWYRWPSGADIRNSVCRLGDGLDVRGTGGYVVAPPSVGYEWIDCDDDTPIADAPDWLLQLVTAPHEAHQAATVADAIPNGQRNEALARIAGRLRRMGLGREEINDALQSTNRHRCSPPLSPLEVERVAASIARYEPDQLEQAEIEGWVQAYLGQHPGDQETDAVPDPGPLPDHLLDVPGLVKLWTDHIEAQSFRSQPILALGCALTAMGALIGRKVQTETGSRSNIYSLGLAASGAGKDKARQVVKTVLSHGCQGDHARSVLGTEDLASDAGMVRIIQDKPSVLFLLDEMARFLATAKDPARHPNTYGIISALLRLYSAADGTWSGKAYANAQQNVTVEQPCVCLYGTTVPEVFFATLSQESVIDGFLARLLIWESADSRPEARRPIKQAPPAELIEGARRWYFKAGGNLSGYMPEPQVVPCDDDARGVWQELHGLVDDERERVGDILGTLWSRVAEKAERLALIYACSRDDATPLIDGHAAQWASDVVVHLTRRLVWQCSGRIAENQQHADTLRLLRILREAGRPLSKSQLIRATQWLRKSQRDELLATLVESGQVITQQSSLARGRPCVEYSAR